MKNKHFRVFIFLKEVKNMKNLIIINVFIFIVNILIINYNFIQIKNAEKSRNKYKKIIKAQKIQLDFLDKELEDVENEEIFEGGIINM